MSGDYSGKDEVLGFFGKMMGLSGGTFHVEVLDILANDEHGVTLTMEGGQREGKALANHAVHMWDMRDGKCAQLRGYTRRRGKSSGRRQAALPSAVDHLVQGAS